MPRAPASKRSHEEGLGTDNQVEIGKFGYSVLVGKEVHDIKRAVFTAAQAMRRQGGLAGAGLTGFCE
jgi:hypothetical protein